MVTVVYKAKRIDAFAVKLLKAAVVVRATLPPIPSHLPHIGSYRLAR